MSSKISIQTLSSETSQVPSKSVKSPSKERINTLWGKEENLIYIQFLRENRDHFTTQEVRRHNKVFIQLAKLMPSRTSDQCRSHHQKMMISHGSIDKIIKHLQKKTAKLEKKEKKREVQTEIETPVESEMEPQRVNEKKEQILTGQMSQTLHTLSIEDSLWDVLL